MDFNQLVLDKIGPILANKGFKIADQVKGYILFRSDRVNVSLGYSNLDKTHGLQVGVAEGGFHFINDNILQKIFHFHLQLDLVPTEIFVENVKRFFNADGIQILNGDMEVLNAIKRVAQNESRTYTSKMLQDQILDAANRAWENRSYKEFVSLLEKVDIDNLPISYQMKFKIARKNL